MAKYPHAKNLKNPHRISSGKCITDAQIDRRTDEQDWFYRTLTTKVEVRIMLFENLRTKSGNNQHKKKEYNQHISVFKEFKNNDP